MDELPQENTATEVVACLPADIPKDSQIGYMLNLIRRKQRESRTGTVNRIFSDRYTIDTLICRMYENGVVRSHLFSPPDGGTVEFYGITIRYRPELDRTTPLKQAQYELDECLQREGTFGTVLDEIANYVTMAKLMRRVEDLIAQARARAPHETSASAPQSASESGSTSP